MCNQCSNDGSPLCETCLVEERLTLEYQRLAVAYREQAGECERLREEVADLTREIQRRDHCHCCGDVLVPPFDDECRCESCAGRDRSDMDPAEVCDCKVCRVLYAAKGAEHE